MPIVTDYEAYLFGEGHWHRAWEKMGARPAVIDGTPGFSFVVWAPTARGVAVRLQTHLVNRAAELYRRLGFQERGRTVTHILMEWRVGEAPMD